VTEQAPLPPVQLEVVPDTQMSQLVAEYRRLKEEIDQRQERIDAIKSSLKVLMQTAAPDAEKVRLQAPGGKALLLTYKRGWRLDTKKLKYDAPETWQAYAVATTTWELREER